MEGSLFKNDRSMQRIKYLENADIDRKKWDYCIERSRAGLLYGLSWYLDLVSPGWAGLVDDDYKAVMPLPIKERFGIKYVYQPVLTQQLGIYSGEVNTSEITEAFLGSVPRNIKYVDTHLNYTNHFPENRKVRSTKRINYELSLRKKYVNLKAGYSENTRRNIQRGFPMVELVHDVPVTDLIRLKRENPVHRKPPRYYEWMNCFAHRLVTSGYGKITGAIIDNKLCAAALFVFFDKRIYYLIPVSDEEGKKNRAM